MPTIPVHAPLDTRAAPVSALPELLQTPLGFALLELQGTINFPQPDANANVKTVNVGRLVFPDYDASLGAEEGKWMKRVWFYIGHQRMTGEVKKLPKPLGILRRVDSTRIREETQTTHRAAHEQEEELEIAEIVRWKLVFSSRPEPVGAGGV
jgi:chromosome transmission fidelity protein 8